MATGKSRSWEYGGASPVYRSSNHRAVPLHRPVSLFRLLSFLQFDYTSYSILSSYDIFPVLLNTFLHISSAESTRVLFSHPIQIFQFWCNIITRKILKYRLSQQVHYWLKFRRDLVIVVIFVNLLVTSWLEVETRYNYKELNIFILITYHYWRINQRIENYQLRLQKIIQRWILKQVEGVYTRTNRYLSWIIASNSLQS